MILNRATRAPRFISHETDLCVCVDCGEQEHALNLSEVLDEHDCGTGVKASCSEKSYGGFGVSRPVLM